MAIAADRTEGGIMIEGEKEGVVNTTLPYSQSNREIEWKGATKFLFRCSVLYMQMAGGPGVLFLDLRQQASHC